MCQVYACWNAEFNVEQGETGNFWEPLHFVLYGTGVQNFEWSEEYAMYVHKTRLPCMHCLISCEVLAAKVTLLLTRLITCFSKREQPRVKRTESNLHFQNFSTLLSCLSLISQDCKECRSPVRFFLLVFQIAFKIAQKCHSPVYACIQSCIQDCIQNCISMPFPCL